MKKVTIYLRLVGLVFIFIGVILNFQMYIYEELPTYLFLVLCLFGVLLIGLSYLKKPKS
jgi:TRAP-type C4-dicarboxylate transport system permease small subunit